MQKFIFECLVWDLILQYLVQELAIPAGENLAPFPWQATDFRTSLLFLSFFLVKLGIIMFAFVLICFLVRYAFWCGKKLANNIACGEPMIEEYCVWCCDDPYHENQLLLLILDATADLPISHICDKLVFQIIPLHCETTYVTSNVPCQLLLFFYFYRLRSRPFWFQNIHRHSHNIGRQCHLYQNGVSKYFGWCVFGNIGGFCCWWIFWWVCLWKNWFRRWWMFWWYHHLKEEMDMHCHGDDDHDEDDDNDNDDDDEIQVGHHHLQEERDKQCHQRCHCEQWGIVLSFCKALKLSSSSLLSSYPSILLSVTKALSSLTLSSLSLTSLSSSSRP